MPLFISPSVQIWACHLGHVSRVQSRSPHHIPHVSSVKIHHHLTIEYLVIVTCCFVSTLFQMIYAAPVHRPMCTVFSPLRTAGAVLRWWHDVIKGPRPPPRPSCPPALSLPSQELSPASILLATCRVSAKLPPWVWTDHTSWSPPRASRLPSQPWVGPAFWFNTHWLLMMISLFGSLHECI